MAYAYMYIVKEDHDHYAKDKETAIAYAKEYLYEHPRKSYVAVHKLHSQTDKGTFYVGRKNTKNLKNFIPLTEQDGYELVSNLKTNNPLFARYFVDALKMGAENGNKKGKVKIIAHTPGYKPKIIGEIVFTKEKYLPSYLSDGPELVIYHDLTKITDSREIYLYPNGKAVVGAYMKKWMRDKYLK